MVRSQSKNPRALGLYETGYFLKTCLHRMTRCISWISKEEFLRISMAVFLTASRGLVLMRLLETSYDLFLKRQVTKSVDIKEEFKQRFNSKTIEYMEELNDLSYVSMTIAFEEDLNMSELYQLTEEHPELDFKWAGVRTVEHWDTLERRSAYAFNWLCS